MRSKKTTLTVRTENSKMEQKKCLTNLQKRQEAAPCRINWQNPFPCEMLADGPLSMQLVADDEASCRYATPLS
jgi:hypothetical protein